MSTPRAAVEPLIVVIIVVGSIGKAQLLQELPERRMFHISQLVGQLIIMGLIEVV
jgi:hypothetical protein